MNCLSALQFYSEALRVSAATRTLRLVAAVAGGERLSRRRQAASAAGRRQRAQSSAFSRHPSLPQARLPYEQQDAPPSPAAVSLGAAIPVQAPAGGLEQPPQQSAAAAPGRLLWRMPQRAQQHGPQQPAAWSMNNTGLTLADEPRASSHAEALQQPRDCLQETMQFKVRSCEPQQQPHAPQMQQQHAPQMQRQQPQQQQQQQSPMQVPAWGRPLVSLAPDHREQQPPPKRPWPQQGRPVQAWAPGATSAAPLQSPAPPQHGAISAMK